MRRWKFSLLMIFSLVLLQACNVTVSLDELGNKKATVPLGVSIETPLQDSQVPLGPIDIRYTATAPEGVAVVELSIDGYVVNTYTLPDPSQNTVAIVYTWIPPTSGSHIIRVRDQDSKGTWSEYTDVILTVTGEQAALGTAQQPTGEQNIVPTQPQPTDTNVPTTTPATPYIYAVTHDVNKFYYKNSSCGPTKVTISLEVSDPSKVWSVVIFTRFLDKEGEGQTKWDSGHAMNPKGNGKYSITLESSKISNFNTYDYAILRYQFVATDKERNEVARSEVFEDIEYSICP